MNAICERPDVTELPTRFLMLSRLVHGEMVMTFRVLRWSDHQPSRKLDPQAVGGADGRCGGSPEGQTVTRAVPPIWRH